VSNYIDLLLETEVVEEVSNTSPRRYRVAKSDVVQELFELNSALKSPVNSVFLMNLYRTSESG